MNKIIKTKFGAAKINPDGHYQITTRKEGNHRKPLHRLVWEDHYNKPVPDGYDIHHINENKLDNRIQNLQCVEHGLHQRFHHKGKSLSDETKYKLSKCNNSTGYFRVIKKKTSCCNQGFIWAYQYYEDGKRKTISSVDIHNLEQKVQTKGLPWMKLIGSIRL